MLCVFDKGILSISSRQAIWKIDKFHSLPLIVGCEVRSPEFVLCGSRYTLVIWPRGRKGNDTEEWFGICLYKYDALRSCDSVKFSIVSPLGDIKTCSVECSENNIFRQERFMEWSDFRALHRRITPNGCLTIVCKLSVENYVERHAQNGNDGEIFVEPMNHPPVQYQSNDYHSSDPQFITPSFNYANPTTQISSFEISGVNYGAPLTMNSFYSSTSLENSFEYVPDSTETQNSDFKLPYDAAATAHGNTWWECFTLRRQTIDPNENIPENLTSESIPYSAATIPVTINSAEVLNPSKFAISDFNESSSSSSSQTVRLSAAKILLESAAEVPEKTAQSRQLLNSSSVEQSLQNSFVSTTANSSPMLNHSGEASSSVIPKGLKVLSQHFKNLYLSGKDFDLKIIMEGKEFKVLKPILKNRSPVFDKMLSEDTSNIIHIDPFDACDSTVFHEFLLYIYSGDIENMSYRNVYGLYNAACKFEVPELKEECINFLQTSLTVDTITDVFRSADSNGSELVDIAMVFLAKNMEVIVRTDEWKRFTGEEPGRAYDYILKAVEIGYKKTIA